MITREETEKELRNSIIAIKGYLSNAQMRLGVLESMLWILSKDKGPDIPGDLLKNLKNQKEK